MNDLILINLLLHSKRVLIEMDAAEPNQTKPNQPASQSETVHLIDQILIDLMIRLTRHQRPISSAKSNNTRNGSLGANRASVSALFVASFLH